MISRRLVIGLLGALALYATPVALAFCPKRATQSWMKPFGD